MGGDSNPRNPSRKEGSALTLWKSAFLAVNAVKTVLACSYFCSYSSRMASVWKHPKSKYWSVCYTLADGRRVKESAKLTSRSMAERVAAVLETEARAGLSERDARALAERLHERCGLNEPRARELVARLYERLGGRSLARATVTEFFERWLARKKVEVAPATARKYAEAKTHFLSHLGGAASRDIAAITRRDIAAFRDDLATRLAVGSVNVALKIVRIAFEDALKEKLVGTNEAKTIPVLKASAGKTGRRPFTEKELRLILDLASTEWRAMILTGFYGGGQRLGDIARLTWQNADLAREELRFITRKTGRTQNIPMVPVLHQCLAALPSSDDPKAPVFPHAAALLRASKDEHVGSLSNEFHELLVEAGLAQSRSHKGTGKGRGGRREIGELGFHSLRHTFTSWAKSSGIGSAIVQDIVGHDSAAVSANYTHIDDATKRAALVGLPDLTKPPKAAKPASVAPEE